MHSLRPSKSLLLVLLLTFAVFAPSLGNGFAMDDAPLAEAVDQDGQPDPIIQGWRAPWWYFGQRYWAGTPNDSVLYRPVTVLSFAWTYNLVGRWLPSGWEALPQHLVNLLLHLLAVYLVWWLLRDLACSDRAAVLGAGVFALHALHSEVVAGIVGRAELFSLVFGAWATLVFVRGRVVLAGLLFFLAFCSKESALAWAPFLPCYLLARRWRRDPPGARQERLPWLRVAMGVGVGLLAFAVLRHLAIEGVARAWVFSYEQNPLAHVDLVPRLLTAVKVLGYGLWKCVAPFWLYSLYGPGVFAVVTNPFDPGFLAAAVVLVGWVVAGVTLRRRSPLLFLSAAAFFGFSFITSNLPMPIGTIFGERLFYLPSLGVCLLPALLWETFPGVGRRVILPVLVAWGVANAVVILDRNGAWRDSETLFLGDADRLPASADLQAKAGYMHWVQREDPDRALVYFHRCVERDPEFAATWASIARIHQRRGELDQAEAFYRRALETRFVASSGVEDRTIQDHLMVLLRLGRKEEACQRAAEVLTRKPAHVFALVTAVDHCGLKSPARRAELLAGALEIARGEPHAVLLDAMLGYESSGAGDAQRSAAIAQALGWALSRVDLSWFTPQTRVRAKLYLGDVLATLGRRAEARAVLEELLRDKAVLGATRTQVETMVRELGR